MAGGWTKGPWFVNPGFALVEIPGEDAPICQLLWPTELRSESETYANGRLIAAAPDLAEAAAKHLEWIDKERAGPDYGGLTRDTHPAGAAIWSRWWSEQLDLCAETEALARAALAKARGE